MNKYINNEISSPSHPLLSKERVTRGRKNGGFGETQRVCGAQDGDFVHYFSGEAIDVSGQLLCCPLLNMLHVTCSSGERQVWLQRRWDGTEISPTPVVGFGVLHEQMRDFPPLGRRKEGKSGERFVEKLVWGLRTVA